MDTRALHAAVRLNSISESRLAAGVDQHLIKRIARGDDRALKALYARFGDDLFRYLVTLVSDRCLAEEILQDVFVAAWRGARSYRGDSSVKTWLFAIGRRRARDARRSYRHTTVDEGVLDAFPDPAPGPEETLVTSSQWRESIDLLEGLSIHHREALTLVFFHGFTYAETAHVLEIPVGTVKSRLSAARKMLRQSVETQDHGYG